MRALALLLLVCAACKAPGEITISYANSPPADADRVLVYAVADASCASCACGACFAQCSGDRCELGDDGALAPIAELSELDLSPAPGSWAVVTEFYRSDAAGDVLVGSACLVVDVDADGTASHAPDPIPIDACPAP